MRNGSLLGFIGSVLIILNGIVSSFIASAGLVVLPGIPSSLLLSMSLLGLISGFVVLLGSYMTLKGRTAQKGGIIMIVFSVIGLVVGSGWFIGSILGIVGGSLILAKK